MSSNDQVPSDAPTPGIYQHYKGPRYQVLGMARHSETEEWLVVYQALYGSHGFWLRPLTLWLEPVSTNAPTEAVEQANRPQLTRFTLIETSERTLAQLTN